MCTGNTMKLAEILLQYVYQNQYDVRVFNYYPLLDRLVDWMDDTYGTDKEKVVMTD